MGVSVLTDSPVQAVREGEIDLPDRTVTAENLIWAAGIEAVPLTKTLGVETDKAGRLMVEKDLSLPGHRNVFAVGDIAHCIDKEGVRVPGLCPAAIQMGDHVAKVLKDEVRIEGDAEAKYGVRPQFAYFDKGSMATIGRSAAVAESMGLKFHGFIAWLMWLFIHLLFLVGFRNKVAVLLQWFYAYVRYRRGARIITGMDKLSAAES